jgi:hypothetical protein
MVCCLVIEVGVGGGTTTGAGKDGSVVNLGVMTLFELRRLWRKHRVAIGSGILFDSGMFRLGIEDVFYIAHQEGMSSEFSA